MELLGSSEGSSFWGFRSFQKVKYIVFVLILPTSNVSKLLIEGILTFDNCKHTSSDGLAEWLYMAMTIYGA